MLPANTRRVSATILILLLAPLLAGLVAADPIGGATCTPSNPSACVEATCETDAGVSSCAGCATFSGGGSCTQFDNFEPPAGMGNLDAWLDANGDRMYGPLDMAGYSLVLNGTPVSSRDGHLWFGNETVCVHGDSSCIVELAQASVTDVHISATAGIAWSKVAKTGSSLADLASRSASDLTGTLPVERLPSSVALLDATTGRLAVERLPTRAALLDTVTGKLQLTDIPDTVAQLDSTGRLPVERLPSRAALLDGSTGKLPLATIPSGVALLDSVTGKLSLAVIPQGVALLDSEGRLALSTMPEGVAILDAEGRLPVAVLPTSVALLDSNGKLPFGVLPSNLTALDVEQTWTAIQSFGTNARLDAATITSGTIASSRLPPIVDALVAPAAAINWTKLSKTGSSLADLDVRSAADLTSGTLADARLSANVGLLDRAGTWTGVQTFGVNARLDASTITDGTIDASRLPPVTDAMVSGTAGIAWSKISKVGSSLAELGIRSASDLTSGTLDDARLSARVALLDDAGKLPSSNLPANLTAVDVEQTWTAMQNFGANAALDASTLTAGTIDAARLPQVVDAMVAPAAGINWTKLSKTGSSLADLDVRSASDLTSGTLADARLSGLVALLNRAATWSAVQDFGANARLDASTLTSGTVDAARLPPVTDAMVASGAGIAWGKLSKTGSSLGDLGTRSAADLNAGTLADARLAANVSRVDRTAVWSALQDFGANARLHAATLVAGILDDARLAANVSRTDRPQEWTAVQTFGANAILDASAIASGTLADAALAPNVSRLDVPQQWMAQQDHNALVITGEDVGTPSARGQLAYSNADERLSVATYNPHTLSLEWTPLMHVRTMGTPPATAGDVAYDTGTGRLFLATTGNSCCSLDWVPISTMSTDTSSPPLTAGQLAFDLANQMLLVSVESNVCCSYEWRSVVEQASQNNAIDVPVGGGAVWIALPQALDGAYGVTCTTNWDTTVFVDVKLATEYRVRFGTLPSIAAPTVDCSVFQ